MKGGEEGGGEEETEGEGTALPCRRAVPVASRQRTDRSRREHNRDHNRPARTSRRTGHQRRTTRERRGEGRGNKHTRENQIEWNGTALPLFAKERRRGEVEKEKEVEKTRRSGVGKEGREGQSGGRGGRFVAPPPPPLCPPLPLRPHASDAKLREVIVFVRVCASLCFLFKEATTSESSSATLIACRVLDLVLSILLFFSRPRRRCCRGERAGESSGTRSGNRGARRLGRRDAQRGMEEEVRGEEGCGSGLSKPQ